MGGDLQGTECCNGRDCSGRELVCNVATKACEKKGACGEEGKRCCNGKDCTGRHLACDVEGTKTCKKRPEQPACKASECCGGALKHCCSHVPEHIVCMNSPSNRHRYQIAVCVSIDECTRGVQMWTAPRANGA